MCGKPKKRARANKAIAEIHAHTSADRARRRSTYTITIEGGSPDEDVRLDLPAGVDIAGGLAVGTNITIINGVTKSNVTNTWQITCSEPGEHVIPTQEIHVGGVPYSSNETKLVVKDGPAETIAPANAAGDPLLTIEIEKRQIYLGEIIPVTVNLYTNRRTLLRRLGLIEMPKDSFAVQRFPMQGEDSTILLGGQPYRLMAFHSTLSALKPGKFKVGPATMEITVEVPSENGGGFGFFQQGVIRRIKPQCNDVDLTVLPLPTEGRPKNFNGVVGDFQLSLSADPRDLAVGDPIAAELTISGTGNFDTLTVPALTDGTDWKLYPARRLNLDGVNSSNVPALDGSQLATQRVGFTQVLIPKKKLDSIPPFEFSYFSPTKKQYFTLRTDPVPLTMREPERPAEAMPHAATGGAAANISDNDAEKTAVPKTKITDILTVTPTSAHWLAASNGIWSDEKFRMTNFILAAVLALLVAVKGAGAAFAAWQVSASTPQRAAWLEMGKSDLPRTRFYELAAILIQSHPVESGEMPEALTAILARHETLSFSPHHSEPDDAISDDERTSVMSTLKPLI